MKNKQEVSMENYLPAAPGFYQLQINIGMFGHRIDYLPIIAWRALDEDFLGITPLPITTMGYSTPGTAILSPGGRVNVSLHSFKDIDEWIQWAIEMEAVLSGKKEQNWGASNESM